MRLIYIDAALACFREWVDQYGDVHTLDEMQEYRRIKELPPVDAIPIDWIKLFNSTPIGGDSIDDLLREWRCKQEVEAERERDEDGNEDD